MITQTSAMFPYARAILSQPVARVQDSRNQKRSDNIGRGRGRAGADGPVGSGLLRAMFDVGPLSPRPRRQETNPLVLAASTGSLRPPLAAQAREPNTAIIPI